MTFWQAIRDNYRGSLAFIAACPLLFLIPILVEMIQHVGEVHIGMYDSIEAAKATEHHPLRMALGFAKVLAMTLSGYWVVRFLAWRDGKVAGRWEQPAVRLYAIFVLFQLLLAGVQLFLMPQTMEWALGGFAVGEVIAVLVAGWAVAAPLGNAAIGPFQSARLMAPYLAWTIAYFLTMMMPLMVVHYALAGLALTGKTPLWPTLVIDSFVVGWLTVVMMGSSYFAALRAGEKKGVSLIVS